MIQFGCWISNRTDIDERGLNWDGCPFPRDLTYARDPVALPSLNRSQEVKKNSFSQTIPQTLFAN